jgi:hypothetical protein
MKGNQQERPGEVMRHTTLFARVTEGLLEIVKWNPVFKLLGITPTRYTVGKLLEASTIILKPHKDVLANINLPRRWMPGEFRFLRLS